MVYRHESHCFLVIAIGLWEVKHELFNRIPYKFTEGHQHSLVRISTETCIEKKQKENTTTPNLWDSVKAALRGRFIAIQAYLKKTEKSQINNITLHLSQEKRKK